MDGTLANVEGVRHHVLGKNRHYDRFHSEAISCPPHEWVADLARLTHHAGYTNLVVTARGEKYRKATGIWLALHDIPHDHLIMRPFKDMRKDYLVKADMFRCISRGYDVRIAVDDNPNIIALWHSVGVPIVFEVLGWAEG